MIFYFEFIEKYLFTLYQKRLLDSPINELEAISQLNFWAFSSISQQILVLLRTSQEVYFELVEKWS